MSDKPIVVIATPVRGDPHLAPVTASYHMATLRLCRSPHLDFLPVPSLMQADLVRSRSAFVRDALATTCTHVLWWDEDVIAPAEQLSKLISALLATGHDYVGCAYPRKALHWDRLLGRTFDRAEDIAHAIFEYTAVVDGERDKDGAARISIDKHCAKVSRLGLGFTHTSRCMLETMCDHYASTLQFRDTDHTGETRLTVALFQLMLRGEDLLSEDFSFCERWRDIGGTVHLYCGPHSGLQHIGPMAYGVAG